ncbi:hypothetical protein T484DRAFT_1819723 [Baffinella frigidus]|nr:hypothetical protein T484DRAFT_1819723 [Cryptophyta sp. CCMP2293]
MRLLLAVALCASADAFSVAPAGLSLRAPAQICAVRRMPRHGALRMAEQQEVGAVEVVEEKAAVSGYSAVPEFKNKRKDSWWSRNLSEEDLNKPRFYDIEAPGEFLAGADRQDPEQLTEMGKWQRTMSPIYIQWSSGEFFGPIYIQWSSGGFFVGGFIDYFLLGNPGFRV